MQTIEDLNLLDPAKKGKDYCLRMAKDLHNSNNNSNSFFFNQKVKWELFRKYSRGEQPINNAKNSMGRNKKVNFDSLNWSVPKAMPIIFDIMEGIISRLDLEIECDSVDPESVRKKELDRYRKEAEILLKNEIAEIEGIGGYKLRDPANNYQDTEELDIDIDAGKYKLNLEIAMEQVIKELFNVNRFQELRKALILDGANCGVCVLRHYVQKNGLIKIRRVDPLNFVSDYVTTRDFREVGKVGEYVEMNMAQFRQISNFTDEEYVDIALKVCGKYGNPAFSNLGSTLNAYRNPIGGGYIFDRYIVRFLYAEWATTNRYNHIVDKPNKVGNKKTIQVPHVNYEAPEQNKPYAKTTDYLVWYKCSWVIDTDYAFDYGPVEFPNVQANALNESQPTFAICAVNISNMITSTYTERVTDQMDLAFLAWMQYQSHLAKAVPPGVAADILALTNIPNGKSGNMQPLDVLDRFVATGNLLMNSLLPNGQIMQRSPIEILNGSDFSKAVAFYNQFLQHIQTAKSFLGINEFVDASNPNPDASVGGAKLAVQGTNNSLVPLISCIDTVFEKVAEGIVNRSQHMAANGELEYMSSAIGKQNLLMLSVSEELSVAAFGIAVSPRPDRELQAKLDQYIQLSLAQRSQTGVGGIEIEDALAIERYKNPKAKERLLVKKREQRQVSDMKMSRQKQEDNAMVQKKSIIAQKESQKEVLDKEFEILKRTKDLELQYKEKEMALEFKYKEKELILQGKVKDENIITQGVVDKKLQDSAPKETSSEK